MEESRYATESVSFVIGSKSDIAIASIGTSIIVTNPFDSSDIILAIFFLCIIYSSPKELGWQNNYL